MLFSKQAHGAHETSLGSAPKSFQVVVDPGQVSKWPGLPSAEPEDSGSRISIRETAR